MLFKADYLSNKVNKKENDKEMASESLLQNKKTMFSVVFLYSSGGT